MKLSHLFGCLALGVLTACANNADNASVSEDTSALARASETAGSPEATMLSSAFPNMYMMLKGQDTNFDPSLFEESEGGYGTPPPPRFFAPEELEQFKPFLIYNADSTKALDLVSYNFLVNKDSTGPVLEATGPDTEVGVINMKDNMRTRIFFSGPGTILREGKWLDSTTVLLGGAESVSNTAIKPFVVRINLKEKTLQRFSYPDSVRASL